MYNYELNFSIRAKDIRCRKGWLVYKAVSVNTRLADQAWDIGFQDTAEMDDMGIIGLMRLKLTPKFGIKLPALNFQNMAPILVSTPRYATTQICNYSALHPLAATFTGSLDLRVG